jgi:hypothetical protein
MFLLYLILGFIVKLLMRFCIALVFSCPYLSKKGSLVLIIKQIMQDYCYYRLPN